MLLLFLYEFGYFVEIVAVFIIRFYFEAIDRDIDVYEKNSRRRRRENYRKNE